eukprot:4126286-Lingulodinium_polyedra.AAC.1
MAVQELQVATREYEDLLEEARTASPQRSEAEGAFQCVFGAVGEWVGQGRTPAQSPRILEDARS